MNSQIQAYIDGMFKGVTLEGEAAELHDELCANCSERYEDLLRQGYNAEEALAFVREGMGDVDELIAPYRKTDRAPESEPRMEKETAPYFEQALDVTGVTAVEIDARSESVSVIVNSGEEFVVIYECDGDEGFEVPAIACENGVLRVQTPQRENAGFSFSLESTLQSLRSAFRGRGLNSARLTLAVPQGMMPGLTVRGGSGSLRLESVAIRSADVHLASGSIRVETDARVRGGTYELHTASGSIRCCAAADKIILHSMSGSVKAVCDARSLNAQAVSGSVRVEGQIRETEAKSVSGSVHVTLENADAARVCAHSVSGSVHIALPEAIGGFVLEAKSVSGRVHNAFGADEWGSGEAKISASSTSGSVRIEKA